MSLTMVPDNEGNAPTKEEMQARIEVGRRMGHSPLPWKVAGFASNEIRDARGVRICRFPISYARPDRSEQAANAHLIVDAVNGFYAAGLRISATDRGNAT